MSSEEKKLKAWTLGTLEDDGGPGRPDDDFEVSGEEVNDVPVSVAPVEETRVEVAPAPVPENPADDSDDDADDSLNRWESEGGKSLPPNDPPARQ